MWMASDSSQSRWSRSANMNCVFLLKNHFLRNSGRYVESAFLVLRALPPPAAGAHVLAGLDRPRARRTADRPVALVVEAVVGDGVVTEGAPDVRLGPGRERVVLVE